MTSTVKVNNVQASDGGNIINQCGTNITIGASGDTIALASGASQTGFGRSGSVNWQTTPKTATFTAVDGEGYFINQGSQITANLPAGSAGAIVAFSDYARNFATYNLVISPNGSEKIGGIAQDAVLGVDGQSATFVYVDATKGWVNVQNAEDTETGQPPFMTATGGTITECGNCKVHTFTGPGTFEVTKLATCCAAVNNLVSYLVVAGGGGGGSTTGTDNGAGGGAGGYRELVSPGSPYTGSPTQGYPTPGNRITVTQSSFPIVVGGGGSGALHGAAGSNSSAFPIVAAGGGGGGGVCSPSGFPNGGRGGGPGGSGGGSGGGGVNITGGVGNTPPTTPAQGSNGGNSSTGPSPDKGAGGGGGATAAGAQGGAPICSSGDGGAGATSSINGTPTVRAGGGGGAPTGGQGGPGGGADGGQNASDNTGGGGGGNRCTPSGGNGGSGIVIIRYKFQ